MSRRAGAPLALLTLALAVAAPAPAAGLADTLAAADAALRSALGTEADGALLVPFCTLTVAGAARPLVLLTRRSADGRVQRHSLLLDAGLHVQARLDHGDGGPQRCAGARIVIAGDARDGDGRVLAGPVLRLAADGRVQADDTDPNALAIERAEPAAAALAGRPAAAVQTARALVAATLHRLAPLPKGQTLAGWQPLCTLAAGGRSVPVLGWLGLALPQVAPGDYVPPAHGSRGLLLTDAVGAPLAQIDVPATAVTGCTGTTLRLAQPVYGSDCRARAAGLRCRGDEGEALELAPDGRTLTLMHGGGTP